jgi:hypothetical protein
MIDQASPLQKPTHSYLYIQELRGDEWAAGNQHKVPAGRE